MYSRAENNKANNFYSTIEYILKWNWIFTNCKYMATKTTMTSLVWCHCPGLSSVPQQLSATTASAPSTQTSRDLVILRPHFKYPEWGGKGNSSVVECMVNMHEVLDSIPNTSIKKKRKKEPWMRQNPSGIKIRAIIYIYVKKKIFYKTKYMTSFGCACSHSDV